MITFRPSGERGTTRLDWLDSRHSFSFGDYLDPRWMGYRALRVINEDVIAPGGGFPSHPHRDMEIVTWVAEGRLEHRDSLGTGSIIAPGEVQRMTAGSGIVHSEFNPSDTEPTRLLQIWIQPGRRGLKPGYEQKPIESREGLVLVASPDGSEGSVRIHAGARLYAGRLRGAMERRLRHGWIQIVRGKVRMNGTLQAGDGAAIDDETVRIEALEPAEFLLFELD